MLAPTLQPSTPAQIMLQMFGRGPMKSFYPLFEPAVVSINVLDKVNASNDSNADREIDGAMGYSKAVSHRSVDGSAIAAENSIFRQNSLQRVRLSSYQLQSA